MQPASSSPGTGIDPARLIQDHQAGVWRYLRALGCEASLADDLTQDTFLAVLKRPFQDLGPAAVSAYLRKIAFNLHITHLRRNGKVVAMENLEELDSTWSRLASDDPGQAAGAAVRDGLKSSTPRARLA